MYSNIIFNAPARLSALLEQMKLAESRHAAELEGKGGNGPAGSEKPVPKKKPIKDHSGHDIRDGREEWGGKVGGFTGGVVVWDFF